MSDVDDIDASTPDIALVNSKITQAGTPCYMAPELLEGKSFNKAVDVVYPCGCKDEESPPIYGIHSMGAYCWLSL